MTAHLEYSSLSFSDIQRGEVGTAGAWRLSYGLSTHSPAPRSGCSVQNEVWCMLNMGGEWGCLVDISGIVQFLMGAGERLCFVVFFFFLVWCKGGRGWRGMDGEMEVFTLKTAALRAVWRTTSATPWENCIKIWVVCNLLVEAVLSCRHNVNNSLLFFFLWRSLKSSLWFYAHHDHTGLSLRETKPQSGVSVPGGRSQRLVGRSGMDFPASVASICSASLARGTSIRCVLQCRELR